MHCTIFTLLELCLNLLCTSIYKILRNKKDSTAKLIEFLLKEVGAKFPAEDESVLLEKLSDSETLKNQLEQVISEDLHFAIRKLFARRLDTFIVDNLHAENNPQVTSPPLPSPPLPSPPLPSPPLPSPPLPSPPLPSPPLPSPPLPSPPLPSPPLPSPPLPSPPLPSPPLPSPPLPSPPLPSPPLPSLTPSLPADRTAPGLY